MNYQDTIKFDENKRQYVDAFGYPVSSTASKHLKIIENEEVQESYPNVVTIQGSDVSPVISADASKDADVDIIIEPKGTGSVRSNGDIVSNSIIKQNQVRISSDDTGKGIISVEGLDAIIDVELKPKGATGKVATTSDIVSNTSKQNQVRISSDDNRTGIVSTEGTDTDIDLSLRTQGNGSIYFHDNNTNFLGFSKYYPATLRTYGTGNADLGLVPLGTGAVTAAGPLFSTYGYLLLKKSADQALTAGVAAFLTFDTEVKNTFGAGYWLTSNTFKNITTKSMKVAVSGFLMPSATVNGSEFVDARLEVFNDSNVKQYAVGRYLFDCASGNGQFVNIKADAHIHLDAGWYFKWWITITGANMTVLGSSDPNIASLCITQIP